MSRIRLIHWNAAEAAERAARLRAGGHRVDAITPVGLPGIRAIGAERPAAVVIDLSRLPMQGRDVGLALRHTRGTRHIPLVFVGGSPEKVARVRQHLPDATYTTWPRIRADLKRAITRPPAAPVTPRSLFDPYAGVPLAQKLGINPGIRVALIDAPPGFAQALEPLPAGVQLQRRASGRPGLTIWFARSQRDLSRRIRAMVPRAERGALWILWPKQGSGVPSDLTQVVVRRRGLAAGLVDFKISAIDATWSGLRFTRR